MTIRLRHRSDAFHRQRPDDDAVAAFERAVLDYLGASRGVATVNRTAALHAALEAAGVRPGDKVLTGALGSVETANAVRFAGGEPVFVDVVPSGRGPDPACVERALRAHEPDVAAVLAADCYGVPAPAARLAEVAAAHDVPLVEDASDAFGATVEGRPAGAAADVVCAAVGPDRGAVAATDDEAVAERTARFVRGGLDPDRGVQVELGHDFRPEAAAVEAGLERVATLSDRVDARRDNAAALDRTLADAACRPLPVPPRVEPAYPQYVVRLGNPEAVRASLADAGVESDLPHPAPLPAHPSLDRFDANAPVGRALADQLLAVPVHADLSQAHVEAVADALVEAAPEPPAPLPDRDESRPSP